MMIRIRYPDGRFDMVKATRLDDLIESEEIEGFRRVTGWVVLGKDPVRGQGLPGIYSGPERRGMARQPEMRISSGYRQGPMNQPPDWLRAITSGRRIGQSGEQ